MEVWVFDLQLVTTNFIELLVVVHYLSEALWTVAVNVTETQYEAVWFDDVVGDVRRWSDHVQDHIFLINLRFDDESLRQ